MAHKLGWAGAGLGGGGPRVTTAARNELEAELTGGLDTDEMRKMRISTAKSRGGEEEVVVEEEEDRNQFRAITAQSMFAKAYTSPAGRLDASVWEAWEEMEGDEDGSGDVASMIGELAEDKTREDPLGKFTEEAVAGTVLQKTGTTPCWCSGYGQNPGPDSDGWCSWEMDVLRRDGNLFLGVIVPSAVEGELDRAWNSKCFRNLSFYWATTAGTLMNGPDIKKCLPTKKIPVFHCNPGDTIRMDLKTSPREVSCKVVSVETGDMALFNAFNVKMRIMPNREGKMGTMLEELPPLYLDGAVYCPTDYEMLEGTFVIALREEPEVGDMIDMRLTGELVLTHKQTDGKGQAYVVGRFQGVPHDSAPAVCLNSKGDMVRLRGVWGSNDQGLVAQVRERILMIYGRETGVEKDFAANSDPVRGLADWVLLKCLRTQDYDMEMTVQECIKYVKREAKPVAERNRKLDVEAMKLVKMTSYTDDYVGPKFKLDHMRGQQEQEEAWKPKSIPEALAWKPRTQVD